MKLIGKQSGAALPLDETLPAPDAAPLRLDEWLPYQLFLPAQHVARVLAEFYGPRYGIGQPAWRILATIADRPGTNARQIGAALGMDAVSVSRGIAQLVGAGFARRDAARNDRRYACVMATPAGRAAFDDIAAVCIAVERRLLDVLTPEERATLAAPRTAHHENPNARRVSRRARPLCRSMPKAIGHPNRSIRLRPPGNRKS
ncbi:MarR family transcriptional regulator [Burkholderia pseudomallei]|nr:MarR family transcriptional regulator [Burkholderia pseudomallei]CAJ3720246.1 MarR family transcriptional regulator [Burkholderia pseudomallei]CAJ3810285.1 MarR family transcriptional regulator [Burkholderia pseudomallei]CAJ4380684.1 MarR family transcriptional regulator [Burkholderia pseudomallei]CAJ4400570.1 MarR family transcriptional regulator [Burkholderia pseudomallei]